MKHFLYLKMWNVVYEDLINLNVFKNLNDAIPLSIAWDIFLCMKILGEVGEKLQYHKPLGQVIQMPIWSVVIYFSFIWLWNIESFWQRPALIYSNFKNLSIYQNHISSCSKMYIYITVCPTWVMSTILQCTFYSR